MNKFARALVLAIFFLCAPLLTMDHAKAGAGDSYGLSPYWDWKEIETEHFRIVFPAEVSKQAERVARIYEEANETMKGDLRWEPLSKVNVLLVDNSDAANGLTTPISRFGMLLYLTPPDPFFSTDNYDDWLRLLIFHEYTHFLNMDATRGVFSFARYIFGDVFLPNATWPSWMLEGYAVYNETKFTKSGRGRSPYWEGVLRTIVEGKALNRPEYITLDQVNGTHPHFPSGEVAYIFGYSLMNEAERTRTGALTDMTYRGSERFPYFINGNVSQATGKDWYELWEKWVGETNTKMDAQLAKIKSLPLSKTEVLDGTYDNSYGLAFSPDGKWVAYSTGSEHRWQTLRFREWKPGAEPKNIEDKFYGSAMTFTPDSKQLIYSSLHNYSNYNFYSDLRAYNFENGNNYWLTDGVRARDPDVSRDGKWIVFTEASESGTHLALAKLTEKDGKLSLEGKRKLFKIPAYERVANPKFSADGKGIVFAWKKTGKTGDDLYYYGIEKNTISTLMSDNDSNRFPAFDSKGKLYFVSDRSGVDNVYRYEKAGVATLVTNTTGGIWLPTFRGEELYGSLLTKDGFSHAKIEMLSGLSPEKISVTIGDEAPEATVDLKAKAKAEAMKVEVKDYHALPTLLPRQWAPFLLADEESNYFGADVFGYDNTFRHQYFGYGAYDTTAKTFDYSVQYENRSFGPTLMLYASNQTKDVVSAASSAGGYAFYTRERETGGTLSFPFQGTTSVFTPALGYKIDQSSYYGQPGLLSGLRFRERRVPQADVSFTYANTRSSRLSVSPERGSQTMAGVRRYDMGEEQDPIFKGIFKHTQFLNLGNHFVLSPTLKAMKVNYRDFSYLDASSISRGRRNRVINPLYSDEFDEFGIRGYRNLSLSSREAITFSTDLKFPLIQIFRGWGTNPLFFDQLWMQIFGEDTYRPSAVAGRQHLPSAGAGLRFNADALFYLPLTFGLDYQKGFNEDALGQSEVFFSISTSSLLPF